MSQTIVVYDDQPEPQPQSGGSMFLAATGELRDALDQAVDDLRAARAGNHDRARAALCVIEAAAARWHRRSP